MSAGEAEDFLDYLLMKAERQEREEWTALSLSSATRNIEDEEALYTLSDLEAVFRWRNQGKSD